MYLSYESGSGKYSNSNGNTRCLPPAHLTNGFGLVSIILLDHVAIASTVDPLLLIVLSLNDDIKGSLFKIS